jgi:MFS family permease
MAKQNKIKKSLKVSFWEGTFSSCTSGLVSDYVTPYALALKASTQLIGALSAVPFLASSLAQLKAAEITEFFKSRKRMMAIFIMLHLFMLVPIMLVPYLFQNQPVLFLILFVTLFTAFSAAAGPVMQSLLGEYIPYNSRGRYFGWRSKIMMTVTIAASLIAGFILNHFRNNVLKGFLIVFSLALFARFISWVFLIRMYEPSFRVHEEAYFSFFDFVKGIKKSNFVQFVLLVSGLQFCVNLAAPFFSVLMLRDLKFNYITYTILVSTVTVIQIFTIGRWGRAADRAGNIKVLKFTALIIASLPLWWIISQNPLYLIFAQALSGFAWAGFNLCGSNFVYDAVTPQKRIRCIGYLSVFVGLGVFLGGIIGGYLASSLPNIFGYKLLTLFLISSLMRFAVVLSISRRIKEVRAVEHVSYRDLLYRIVGIKSV